MRLLAGGVAGFLAASSHWVSRPALAWAAVRRLSQDTDLKTLVNENPADLDGRDLEIQPLEQFGTMGLSDQTVDLEAWRLTCSGRVSRKIRLTYDQVRGLPSLERPVLLICPGFFVNHGRWKGLSIGELAERAGLKRGTTHVTVSGPSGPYEKTFRFSWDEAISGKVFLAFQVNGEPLPVKHGFPLRLVAEGYYGYEWVKYVDRVSFDRIRRA
ncbi:MAG: molybdopterin-dependent oxidoreductase [Desulfobacterota bacterium]|nr:molybdopterin-dependent oxidoreductase [Thermodesulfobacteriota bacterium]